MNDKQTITLKAQKREITGKKVKSLRQSGIIPAVVYGHGDKPKSISVDEKGFEKTFDKAGTSSLVDLEIEGEKPAKVLVHEPQRNPVNEKFIHIDFYRVKMDEKIKTEIPLEFVGESEAVEQNDGSLVTNRNNVEVECFPSDLVNHISVDISSLKTFEDTITVANLSVPSGIEILTDKEEVIAMVEPPRSEEEMADLETPAAADEEKEALEKMEVESEDEKTESGENSDEKTEDSNERK